MAISSHFFIEQNALSDNTLAQSFGPQSSSVFNITTSFSLTAYKKAFSICKGVVLLQPHEDNAKVNLVLRPYTQPFPGLNVKYFVYRGLKKADFFNGANIIGDDPSGNSDFISKIWADFKSFYNNQSVPPFLSSYIGYDDNATMPLATPLSSFFFKESEFVEAGGVFTETQNTAFELPMIAQGKSLGNFANGECGIDVVLNYGDYQHDFDNSEFVFDLAYARKAKATIEILATDTDFQKKLKREQTTQFIDIAAFYGLFINQGIVNSTLGANTTPNVGSVIYSNLIDKFFTKNRWYVYIQSDRSRSYNYYGNYKLASTNTNNLKWGITAPTETNLLTEAQYASDGWPLFIITDTQADTNETNKLFIQLVTDNYVNTALYASIGKIEKSQKNNFCNADFLRQLPDAEGNFSRLTTVLELATPATSGLTMAGLTMLLYQGAVYNYLAGTTTNETNETVNVYATPNFFDDVFGLIKAKPLLQLNADSTFSKMTDEKLSLINHYYERKQQGISAVQTLTVNDLIETGDEVNPPVARVSYITETLNIMTNAVSPTGATTTDTKTTPTAGGTVQKSKTYVLPEPYYYNLKLFTDSTQTITGLELKTYDGTTPTKIILGLTQTENLSLQNLINETMKNPRLFLLDLFEDGNELLSPENIQYQKYKVGVVAENATGGLQLYMPITDIMVYSLDRNYHFSKGYSEYMYEQYGIIYSNFKM